MTKNYTLKDVYSEADDEAGGVLPSGRTLWKWGCGIVVIIIALSLIATGIGFIGGWFNTGVNIVSPANVTEQFRAAYDDMNSLNAVAANVCTLVKSRDSYPKTSDAYTQRDSQVQAQEQNYQRIANHYNAYIHDPFRAKIVRPRDLPDPAPSLQQSMNTACPGNVV